MARDLGKLLKQLQQSAQTTWATLNVLSDNLSVEAAKRVSNAAAKQATPGILSGMISCHLAYNVYNTPAAALSLKPFVAGSKPGYTKMYLLCRPRLQAWSLLRCCQSQLQTTCRMYK